MFNRKNTITNNQTVFTLMAILLCSTLALFSCSDDNSVGPDPPDNNGKSQTDVYIAGYVNNGSHNVAVYWENSDKVELTDGTHDAKANSIFVSDGVVYVAGTANEVATVWKNGHPVVLDGIEAASIFVSDGDIYVSGSRAAHYWKNGNLIRLPYSDYSFGGTSSIVVSDGDVYVAGAVGDNFEHRGVTVAYSFGVYWKNGNLNKVWGRRAPYSLSTISSIAVDDAGDVYVAGLGVFNVEIAWTNGNSYKLLDGIDGAYGSSIVVSDGDVYITGNTGESAVYWKNGNRVELPDASEATSIAVSNGDVYVAGHANNGSHDVAAFWKNENLVELTEGDHDAVAKSIFVTGADS